jgi:hypothetical protein
VFTSETGRTQCTERFCMLDDKPPAKDYKASCLTLLTSKDINQEGLRQVIANGTHACRAAKSKTTSPAKNANIL